MKLDVGPVCANSSWRERQSTRQRKAKEDLLVLVSDNESWVDARRGSTAVINEWQLFILEVSSPQFSVAHFSYGDNVPS
jgi:hypothetical protein